MFYNGNMKITSGYYWEKGAGENEDSLAFVQYLSRYGRLALAVVCDGISGMEKGETASGYAAESVVSWFHHEFTGLLAARAGRARIGRSLYRQFYRMNEELDRYGREKGIQTGTTVTLLLIYENHFVYAHSGDSRIYFISKRKSRQLTKDHSLKNGILYRWVGAGACGRPDIGFGRIKKGDGFLLCTDGFRHFIRERELPAIFRAPFLTGEEQILKRLEEIGIRAVAKGEKDDLSAVYILCE